MTPNEDDGDLPFAGIDIVKVVAYLHAQGFSGGEIGRMVFSSRLKHPESRVARALKKAREQRLFREVFDEAAMSEHEMADLRTRASQSLYRKLQEELGNRSGGVLKDLRVFYSAPGFPTPDLWGYHLARFADNCAWYVRELLGHATGGLAVGWGKSVLEIIQALGRYEPSPLEVRRRRRPVIVIPTMGDPLGANGPAGGTSSSQLARALSEILNGTSRNVPSLDGILPVFPRSYSEDERKAMKKHFEQYRGHLEVFGSRDGGVKGRIAKVDMIITSVGSFQSWKKYGCELMVDTGVPVTELKRLSVGDIGGVLVPRENLDADPAAKAEFEQHTKLWTGITLSHYEDLARRAIASPIPGVVVCAIGQNKARIVYELVVRLRLVNRLAIDQHLAKALEAILREPPLAGTGRAPGKRK